MRNDMIARIFVSILVSGFAGGGAVAAPMMTTWGEKVTSENAWRDYPRPQMVRANWTNLNGDWDYAVTSVTNTPGRPTAWTGRIRVPYALESALSGVGRLLEPDEFLWYSRTINCTKRPDERILLHFGAVDFRTMVFIGHQEVTDVPHEGGHLPFTLDITDYVTDGENVLTVCVWDPTEDFVNSRGKQSFKPSGCFYTRVSGIWQTVWMENVPEKYIRGYKVLTDVDSSTARFEFDIVGGGDVEVNVEGISQSGESGEVVVKIPNAKLWSPETPHLYRFTAKSGKDEVRGYFGMRKLEKRKDEKGVLRFFLNNRPYYVMGTLDQGWWPDGLLTPPSEEAMAFDIRTLKDCGFNAMRKHVKVEPLRYYYLCDKMGLLVIQDLPSGNGSPRSPMRSETTARYGLQRLEQKALMDLLQPVPSVVMWCPYNEGWSQPGEFMTHEMLDFVRRYDATRLVNGPSGSWDWEGGQHTPNGWAWSNRVTTVHKPVAECEAADTVDLHLYRGPGMLCTNDRRISFLGEFGGLGHPVAGHLWRESSDSWGYGGIEDTKTREGLEKTYLGLMDRLADLAAKGLGGSIYTQTTDVELEINGLMTYDRKVLKFDPNVMRKAHDEVRRLANGLRHGDHGPKTVDAVVAGAVASDVGAEPLNWGGRAAHPAVVNPVLTAGDVLSLRGEWEFSVPGRDLPNRNGVWGNFNAKQAWKSPRPIQVPGCWEAQGVGEEGDSETWDPSWDCCPRRIRHKYMGEGWYRKVVKIPEAWKGKRIWLKVGGVKSVGWFWVNDVQVAHVANYCGTEKYDITDLVEPGKEAKIVVDVDNRKPSRKGLMSSSHRWGGIYRDIELEATPMACYIDDAWVRGDFDKRLAEVHVEICWGGLERLESTKVRVTIGNEVAECPLTSQSCQTSQTSQTCLKVPLRNFEAWSPEHPNLYTAKVELVENGQVVQVRQERFGVRKFEVVGKEFRLNGKPFFVRGFGDDCVYPLTGLSPADRAYHRAHLEKARAAGFNFVRLHTHCEVPEYFETADEVGVLVQAELPYYSDVPCEGFEFDPVRDVKELYRNYRRHPSFAVYSMGNEGSYGKVLDRRIHRLVKEMDPDRLKINQDTNREHLSLPDVSDYAGGPVSSWSRGSYDPGRPFVCHEFLNLCVKTDSRTAEKYTGAWMPPVTRESRGEWLAESGLGHDWGDRLQDAQHVLQSVWQKRGIEQARLDPHCGGYCFWTINDVVVWNAAARTYSAQGLFDPFWADKRRGNTAADFARFNSGSCVLVDFCPTQCVFTAGDRFGADVFLAHYGEEPMHAAKAEWRILAGGRLLASGSADVGEQMLGAVRHVAAFDVTVPEVERPAKVSFAVTVGDVSNAWDLWLFPKGPSLAEIRAKASKLGVVIAPEKSQEAVRARREGRPLITVDGTEGKPNVELGWWWMGAQVGTAIRPDRVLGSFPHEGALTPLLFRILKKGRELPVSDMHPDDMIIVGEGGEKCYLYLGERQNGTARAFECHGLDLLSDLPEGNWILNALVEESVRERPLRIVAFGDSITEAVIGIRPEENWLCLLQSDMGEDVRFFNAGVGGNSAREAMRRFDRDVLARRPDVVLIEFGGNNHSPRSPERRVDDEEFRNHLEDFRKRLPTGTRVVAVTFPPIKDEWHGYGRDPFFKNGLDEAMQPQREILRTFAREHGWPIVDLYNVMKDRREELLLRDGVHLNPEGQRVFADEVRRVLRERILRYKGG